MGSATLDPHVVWWCIMLASRTAQARARAHLARQHEAVHAVNLPQVQAGCVWQECQGEQRACHARGR